MSKQNIFVPQVKNHVSRNAFDLSHRRIYSSKLGEILPCLVQDCLPGDKFKIKASSFTRTAPLNEAAFARMKQYYNFYFVPYRLLFRDFPSFVVSQSKSSKAAIGIDKDVTVNSSLPYVSESDLMAVGQSLASNWESHQHTVASDSTEQFLLNEVGLNRMAQTRKLLQYLGYYKTTSSKSKVHLGSDTWSEINKLNNTRLNLFPLLAYQKVYNDFYRFSQWENEQANTYNIDYMSGASSLRIPILSLFVRRGNSYSDIYPKSPNSTMFDMRYVNFIKDSFLGVVPTQQFGAKSTVATKDLENVFGNIYLKPNAGSSNQKVGVSQQGNDLGTSSSDAFATRTSFTMHEYGSNNSIDSHFYFDILTLRAAQARQKFLEVTLSNDSDYKSQIEAHFNVKVSSLQSGLCDYIGGFSADLSLNTVVNQNLADSDASYSAIANMNGTGDFDFECKEHGLIIGVTYTLPFVDYSVIGYDFPVLRTQFDDFALPEYDRLGYEEVDPRLIVGNQSFVSQDPNKSGSYVAHLGYGPRYYDYKTNYDVVLGDFNYFQGGTQPNFTLNLRPNLTQVIAPDASNMKSYSFNGSNISFGLLDDIAENRVSWRSFKVAPQLANTIFNVACGLTWMKNDKGNYVAFTRDDTAFDCFYNVVDFHITKISNLDRLGLPY